MRMKRLALLAVLGSLATAVCEGHACLSWDAGEPTVLQLAMFQRDLVGGGGFVESQADSEDSTVFSFEWEAINLDVLMRTCEPGFRIFILVVLNGVVETSIPIPRECSMVVNSVFKLPLYHGKNIAQIVASSTKSLEGIIAFPSQGAVLKSNEVRLDASIEYEDDDPWMDFYTDERLKADQLEGDFRFHQPASSSQSDSQDRSGVYLAGKPSQRHYTTHRCLGLDPFNPGAVSDGMCLFSNLCLLDGIFTYFQHPDLHHRGLPRLHTVGRMHAVEPRGEFQLLVRNESEIPSGIERSSKVHAFVRRFHKWNFGHVLGDDAWPVLQGMLEFDLLTFDNQIIIEGDSADFKQGAGYPSSKMFLTISGNPVRALNEYSGSNICFERFLTGWGRYGFGSGPSTEGGLYTQDAAWGRGNTFRSWRRLAWDGHGIRARGRGNDDSERLLQVIIIEKDLHRAAHKFGILSTSALASHLSSSLPPSNVTAVSWSGRKLTDQLLILSQTDVAIGLPGSDVMDCIFLPDDALLILPCRRYPASSPPGLSGWERGSPEAILWLRHVPYLHLREYCDHDPSRVSPQGVTLDAAPILKFVHDWLLFR